MSTPTKKPPLVNTSQDPGLEYLNQREIDILLTPTENSTKKVVYEEVTKVINNIFQVGGPSGANGQLQFNQDGKYIGDAELQYNPNTDTLTTGKIVANSITITGNASTFKLPGGYNNQVLKTDGNGNLSWADVFPSVAGNTGKFLVTNGVSIDWSTSNYNSFASTTYVDNSIANLVGTAPAMLNTLAEIANVIGQTNDPQFGIISQLANKANISNLAQVAFSGSYADLSNRPNISTVGSTGNYSDLNGRPTIPTSITDLGISDGSNGQVLTTYGNGRYHFSTVTSGSSFNQTLNTNNNVTFNSVVTGNISYSNANLEIYTSANSAKSVDIYTDWGGNNGGVEVWLKHNDGVEINTKDGDYSWKFANTGALLFPLTPNITSAIVVNDNDNEFSISTDRGNISIWPENSKWLFGANGTTSFPDDTITQITDSSLTVQTSEVVTSNDIIVNGSEFATDQTVIGFGVIPGWSQRTSQQIEVNLFVPAASVYNKLLGLSLGANVIVTYSTLSGNQTFTSVLSQQFTAAGQSDQSSRQRYSGRIDGTLPSGQTGIVSVNFPTYTSNYNDWTFGTDGNLTLPPGGDIKDSTGNSVLGVANIGNWGFRNDTMYNMSGGEINNGDPTHGATAGLVLPENGNAGLVTSLFNTYGNVQIAVANIANSATTRVWQFSTDGNLTLPGNTFSVNYANGTQVQLGGGGGGLPLSNGNSIINIASVDGNITLDADGNIFTFGTGGNLTTPSSLVIGSRPGGGSLLQQNDAALDIIGEGSSAGVQLGWAANLSTPGNVALIAMNSIVGEGAGNIVIAVGNNATTVHSWLFGNNGDLKLPAGGDIVDSTGTSVLGGGNPFNQDLNTGDNVRFANIQVNTIRQGWNNFTKTSGYQTISDNTTTDIWMADSENITSAKFIVQFESETGSPYYENFDTLTCEIVMAKKKSNNQWSAAPITVYGIVHTSENPLVTFGSRIITTPGPDLGKAVLTCTPDPSIMVASFLKVHSVEMISATFSHWDD